MLPVIGGAKPEFDETIWPFKWGLFSGGYAMMLKSNPKVGTHASGLRRGFTLIELLVVIAIIAILAAILFPVFAQAKLSAKKSASISNGKQIGLGMLMYSADYDDYFPMLEHDAPFTAANTWPKLAQPYVKNWLIFRDPTDGDANDNQYRANCWFCSVPATTDQLDTMRGYQSSYGYNYAFLAPGRNVNGVDIYGGGVSQTQISQVADTVMLIDGTAWGAAGATPNCRGTGGGWYSVDAPAILDSTGFNYSTTTLFNWGWFFDPSHGCSWQRYGGAYNRYAGKFNVTWSDGHVKTREPLSLIAGIQYDPVTPQNSRVMDKSRYVWDLE
jgi:prepilin-type N-terminal cleavage/methylation domain-containing protein/prepilin-type processing-associated H-X9-DG protein